ncbi:MAG: ABC transporter ATP-binding protein [Candidatus Sericytochromatia bacterium]|nr:ABC transporter ATP-binding protein [Candidatus Sericytochromatia bacterium]
MNEWVLDIRELSCGYAGRVVLEGVSAHAETGKVVGLLGANGSGKSTLLRTLAGLMPAMRGEIRFLNRELDSHSLPALARLRAYVPQMQPIESGWRVSQIVSMGRFPYFSRWRWHPEKGDDGAIEQALKRAGVWELREEPMAALSGGQRQRVHLARALAQQGKLLLLDEPTAHLDLNFQLVFYRLLRDLAHQDGVTVLVAVHDLNLAAQFCDQLWILGPRGEEGAGLLATGEPLTVLQPALLARAFGIAAQVRRDTSSGLPYVVPAGLPRRGEHAAPNAEKMRLKHVHVIGGGGSAAVLLRNLVEYGLCVSIGVVNLLDSDLVAAAQLGVEALSEAPFSPVGPEARALLQQTLSMCDAVLVSEVPWGSGNIENLRVLASRLEGGPPPRVVLLEVDSIASRDFTGGEALGLYRELMARGARAVPAGGSFAELVTLLAETH